MNKVSRNGKKKCHHFKSDITVHDFADSNPGRFSGLRERKSERSNIMNKKEISKMKQEVEELSWFDKNLDDFDITKTEDNECEEEEEKDATENVKKVVVSRGKHPVDTSGEVYPIDLWFQLAKFIHPESVGMFAHLCRGTNSVVQTVQFWKNMYLRHYRNDGNLPDVLQIDNLECIHGLKARVIRMLNYVYTPLVLRTKTTVPFQNEPHVLIGQRCLLTWHKKIKNVWNFYFKFRKGDNIDTSSNDRKSIKSPDFLRWHQDLFYNPDENCSVLEITSPTFVSLPIVMGLILNQVYLNVSSTSMRYHRLKLILDSSFQSTSRKNQGGMCEVVLDPVLELRVYPWWHPMFQESHSALECRQGNNDVWN